MCGIAGFVPRHFIQDHKEEILQMITAIAHRGPDSISVLSEPSISLGHARLSIVDLKTGGQPMISNNGNDAIVFNGEIYGFKDIKKQLKHYEFKTESDTELILALYEKYGEKLFPHLPGMFAFAIWDKAKQQLILGRDRFGEKPLYYTVNSNGIFFASEIKALKSSKYLQLEPELGNLNFYLKKGFINPEKSIYKDVFQLPAGHYLVYSKGEIKLTSYFELPKKNHSISYNDAIEEFKRLFHKAVSNQMIADVPICSFLSGGLDSSAVVMEALKINPNIQTLSFRFEGDADETTFSTELCQKYNIKNEIIGIDFKGFSFEDAFHNIIDIYDEPFADISALPTYLISKKASSISKVALTGDGGDELLLGYPWYRDLYKMEKTNDISKLRFFIERLKLKFYSLSKQAESYHTQLNNLVAWDSKHKYKDFKTYYDNFNSYFNPTTIKSILQSNYIEGSSLLVDNGNYLDNQNHLDYKEYLQGGILVKTDRAAMANGLELRAPFLDKELVEFVYSLPFQYKIDEVEDKRLLRETYRNTLPKSILGRKKQGFGLPFKILVDNPEINQLKEKYLTNKKSRLYEFADYKSVQLHINKSNQQFYSLLILAMWTSKNI